MHQNNYQLSKQARSRKLQGATIQTRLVYLPLPVSTSSFQVAWPWALWACFKNNLWHFQTKKKKSKKRSLIIFIIIDTNPQHQPASQIPPKLAGSPASVFSGYLTCDLNFSPPSQKYFTFSCADFIYEILSVIWWT